jgi:hypothetical protein
VRFLFEDVFKLQLNVVVIGDFEEDVFDVFERFFADTPHTLGLLERPDSKTFAKFSDFVGRFFLNQHLFEFFLGLRLVDTKDCEMKFILITLLFIGVVRFSSELAFVGENNIVLFEVKEDLHHGIIIVFEEDCIVENLIVAVITFKTINGRHVDS